jgi:hypothetical protein
VRQTVGPHLVLNPIASERDSLTPARPVSAAEEQLLAFGTLLARSGKIIESRFPEPAVGPSLRAPASAFNPCRAVTMESDKLLPS